jgi:hypothetical protein
MNPVPSTRLPSVGSRAFGALTLATPNDYLKAIGLALSLRVSNPNLPIAVACSPKLRPKLQPHFDFVVDEDPTVRGFVHKLHLDRYSPFEETFFFDSDVLVFRDLSTVLPEWRTQSYTACGIYADDGISPFGFDRKLVLRKIGRERLVHIDGAGHSYFRKPACLEVFELARTVVANYPSYVGRPIPISDEDVMAIAMTLLDQKPMPHVDFWSRPLSSTKGTLIVNAAEGFCRLNRTVDGGEQFPHMMHFAANEVPFFYVRQLHSLYRKFGLDTGGLLSLAIEDYYQGYFRPRASLMVRSAAVRLGIAIRNPPQRHQETQ